MNLAFSLNQILKAEKDNELTEAKVVNTNADTLKKVEEAETESTKNQTDQFHTALEMDKLDQERLDNEQRNNTRTSPRVAE